MAINPVRFSHQVCDEYLRYLFSAFPLSDPELAEQARVLLERPSSLDIPLVKGPYVSLSEPFAEGHAVAYMAADGTLHPVMPDLIGFPTMYLHQQRVFESVKQGRHVLVSTGTGSGKTEAFLYPIVDELLRERDAGITKGLKAILIYPMNALANDQLDRLREMLAGTGITFGQWIGTTPDKESDVTVERFQGSSRVAYLAARKERAREAHERDTALRAFAPLEECCSEEDIRQRGPRILITNYRQLEILTTRADVTLFAGAPLRYLVFDEAHTYSGAAGAEVACLIRRVRALAGKTPDEVVCIGTSATLSDPDKEDDAGAAKRFASRFFGVDEAKVDLVGEAYVSRTWPSNRHRPAAPRGDGMERLARLLHVLNTPVDLPALARIIEELTGALFRPGENWTEDLHALLLQNEYAYQCTQILAQPRELDYGAWLISQRVGHDRLPQGPEASAELLAYLTLGAAARHDDKPLLRPKVHLFVRGLDEMVVALDEVESRCKPALFMSISDAREAYPNRRDDAFFPVLVCRSCGQHFFQRDYLGLEVQRGSKNQVKGFANGDAVEGGGGESNAVWAATPEDEGVRMRFTNRLLEEVADSDNAGRPDKWPTGYLCRQCGAFHRDAGDRCLADGCGHQEALLPVLAFAEVMKTCPSCGTHAMDIGGRTVEPIRAVRAVPVADIHILAQAMLNAAPKGHEKLVIFADSRQDAAFQAGWIQDHARRIRLRHMMYRIIADAQRSLSLGDITDAIMEQFRKDKRLVETLLPELTSEDAVAIFGHDLLKSTGRALRYMVLREFTAGIRRRDSLESMGLARVEYAGLDKDAPAVQQWAALVGLPPAEAAEGIALILDIWRRSRMLFVPRDPVYSRYHAKDDEYIQAGLLPLKEFRPQGVLLEAGDQDKYARGLLAQRGMSGVQALIKKWAPDADIRLTVNALWDLLKKDLKIIAPVTLRSQKDTALADVYQVDAEKVFVAGQWSKVRCTTCQRVMPRTVANSACSRHHCKGKTVVEEPKADDYDVALMQKPFIMVSAEEHTAQVPGEEREHIEREFKSPKGRVNCLVATPTLELGVNIGALDMVVMRNVPPLPSNYWQRAGRAGRQERMAVVLTYCGRKSHDRYFFEDPLRLLDGLIDAPTFNLRNPLMLSKHIRSALLSKLILQARPGSATAEKASAVRKQLFPTFIREYLLDENDHYRDVPPSTKPLADYLQEQETGLVDELLALFALHWPEEASDLTTREAVTDIIETTAADLAEVLRRLHRRLSWARATRQELDARKHIRPLEREEEQLLRRCDDFIKQIITRDNRTYTLNVLGCEGFLPGYGVYDGGVTAFARHGFARRPGPRTFELSRASVVGLREFVPGNRLYANRGSFYVTRYQLRADESAGLQHLRVNPSKGIVGEASSSATYGQGEDLEIEAITIADLDLAHEGRITEEESLRFSMPVTVLGRLRRRHRGGKAYKVGELEMHHIHGQSIEFVNVGEAGRVRKGLLGHLVCTVCGAAQTPYAVEKRIEQFTKIHSDRCGKPPLWLALTAQADVDLLQFHDMTSNAAAINIGESLRTAAAQLLDMGPDDLQILIVGKPEDKNDLLVYDPMPGGSGLLEQMLARWNELVQTACALLDQCPSQCETACYSCLKTFRNQFYHPLLNRRDALGLVGGLNVTPQPYRDIPPVLEEDSATQGTPSNVRESQLVRLLLEHHFPVGKCRQPVRTSVGGLTTTPDWLYEDPTNPDIKVAVYQDGMSRNLHGDPKQAQRDTLIRSALEFDGYRVIVVQSRDLDDPEAVRRHLADIAEAIGRPDIGENLL